MTHVIAQRAADMKNRLLAFLLGVANLRPSRTSYPNLAYGSPK